MLEYKAKKAGKRVEKVNNYYASSQICHVCGYRNRNTKDLSVIEWICPKCQTVHNRDVNAAINEEKILGHRRIVLRYCHHKIAILRSYHLKSM